jgi:hypothetical protein
MANRWKGNIIAAAATTSSGTDFTGKANGAWGLNSQLQQKYAGLWSKGVYAPSAPTIGTATGADSQASVNFTASTDAGGGAITSYTATSNPSGITASNAASPIVVTGLANGTAYTFTVHANSSLGYVSAESAPSNTVTPSSLPTSFLAVAGNSSSPSIAVYGWSSITGAGSKYADPSTLVSAAANITFNDFQTGSALFVANATTPFVHGYGWSASSGFGAKFSNPATLPTGAVNVLKMNTAGDCLACTLNEVIPRMSVYSVSSTGFSSLFTNGLGTGIESIYGTSFNFSDTVIAIGGYTTGYAASYLRAYIWSNSSGYGTKYTNPPEPPMAATSITFNNTGDVIFYGGSGVCKAKAWSNGFGTDYAASPNFGSGVVQEIAWDNTNSKIAVAVAAASPYINVYNWSNGFGSKIANPTTLPSGTGALGVSFNYNNSTIAVTTTNNVPSIYPWSSAGFGTKFANISSAPYGTASRISFTGV